MPVFGLASADSSSFVDQAVVTSKPWSLIHNDLYSETSDKGLNPVPGSVQLHRHHHLEGEETQEEGEETEEEVVDEKEELEEEVLMGVAESENDERMKEGDAVNMAKDGEKEKEKDADEVQKEEGAMQKNMTGFVATFSEGTWEDEESPKRNTSVSVTAAEMGWSF